MVLHKLVNSTNVVFHMLDLQPYAMVLPMDKASGERNKKKILSKVFKNNPDTYASYKVFLKNSNTDKNESVETNGVKHEKDEKDFNNHDEVREESSECTQHSSESSESADKFNLKNGDTERLNGEKAAQNGAFRNEDDVSTVDSEKKDSETEFVVTEEVFNGVSRFIERLDTENIIGCMIILAPKTADRTLISPVAGGIVEVFDDYERSIQTMWMNTNIRDYVNFTNLKGKKNSRALIESINDQILAKMILSTLTLRLCAHAYQMTLPNSKRIQHKSRLISIYHQMGQTFPMFAYSFIKEEMQFSKHYEVTSVAIKHNDNPKIPCKCLKQPSDTGEGVEKGHGPGFGLLFFGITESRFSAMYMSTYEPILLGFMNLLSGKVSDASKIVRFEKSVEDYHTEEDYFKAKRRKANLRSKRLQSRV